MRILLFLSVALVTEVWADSAELDEILVTATRRPVSTREISSALTVVDSASVRQEKLLTDALSSEVGVFLQQTTPGQGAVIIRGLKGSAILHLVDGIRLNNAIFRSAPTQYFSLVPAAAVERIEIVRGSPTSLFGSDAIGGVVQLVTRVPKFATDTIAVRGDAFAAYDTAELGKILRGTLDVGTAAFASSLSVEYLKTGDRQTGSGRRTGPSGYRAKAARLVLSATPDNDRSWLLDLHFLEQPETPRVDELVPGFGQTEPSSSEFSFAPNQRLFVHGGYFAGDAWLGLDWKLDLAWQRIVDDRVTRNFEAMERRRESNRSDLFSTTFSGTRQTATGSWIIGGEITYDRVHSARVEENISTGQRQSIAARFPDRSWVRQAALYANLSQRLSRRHLLSAGLRVTNVDISLPETPVSAGVSINMNDLSGDLGWIFDFSDTWQLVANIGEGFRAPNIFDLGTLGERPGNRFNIPNPTLTSERVTHIDVGVRRLSGRVEFEFMLFRLRYRDKITSVLTGDITADGRDVVQSTNAANVSIHGAEVGADLTLTDNLHASAVVNYTWGEQDTSASLKEAADRIPPLAGTLRLDYDRGRGIGVGAWLQFAGSQNRLSARDKRDVRIDPTGTDGWAILGARVHWDDGKAWQVTLGLDNVFDKEYRVHGSGLDAVGRNLSLSVRRVW